MYAANLAIVIGIAESQNSTGDKFKRFGAASVGFIPTILIWPYECPISNNLYNSWSEGNYIVGDILAIEYLKAIKKLNADITPVPVERYMANHNENVPMGDFCSASYIREHINDEEVSKYTPVDFSGLLPVSCEDFTKAIRYAVISKGAEYIKNIREVREGLENKIYENAFTDGTLDDFILSVKSKRYTYSSISRMLFNILLDIRKDNIKSEPEFIRILGLKKENSGYLKTISPDIPLITKCADAPMGILEQDFKATDIYNLFANKKGKADLTTSPIII